MNPFVRELALICTRRSLKVENWISYPTCLYKKLPAAERNPFGARAKTSFASRDFQPALDLFGSLSDRPEPACLK